jgi:hypothetical protein
MSDPLSALVSIGEAPIAPSSPGRVGAVVGATVAGNLLSLAVGTGVVAGASALVGAVLYPQEESLKFAKVGAVAYGVPMLALLGVAAVMVATKDKA